jgi:hypothetical protein
MASPKSPRSIDIAVGRVDATALHDLQENFDSQELFELVDAFDEWRGRIGDPGGLRADLLRLHTMAHTPVMVRRSAWQRRMRPFGNWPTNWNPNSWRSRRARGVR